jgi:serine-type D-Ala-D-Ala carboxypeptidase (penicillin-binding protein 5/6)
MAVCRRDCGDSATLRAAVRRSLLGVAALGAALAVGLTGASAAAPPALQAPTYYVRASYDGAVLASHDAARRVPMASITKLMTVLVALEHARLDDVVTVPKAATGIGESTVNLRAGERVTVRDLAVASLVPSANDAATALALYVGHGSTARFVALMNAKARALGLRDTHYANPHGLDAPGHVSSARDSARLLQVALRLPFVRATARLSSATVAGRMVSSTDDLLIKEPRILAGKTGHTDGAGWAQVAAARADGVTVYAAVLGAPSRAARNDDLLSLLRWGLAQYRPVVAVAAGRTYAAARLPYGRPAVRLVALRPVVRPVRSGRPLVEKIVAPVAVGLPVAQHARLGEVRVYDAGRLVARAPLVAATAATEPGTLGKVRWYATRTLHHLGGLVT